MINCNNCNNGYCPTCPNKEIGQKQIAAVARRVRYFKAKQRQQSANQNQTPFIICLVTVIALVLI